MPVGREWSAQERATVREGRVNGLSAAAIARLLGSRSKQSVLRYCQREGVVKVAAQTRRVRKGGATVWPKGTWFADCPVAKRDKGSPGPIANDRRWI